MREPVTTFHEGVFNGRRLRYAATVREAAVPREGGEPGAYVVSTQYVAAGQGDPADRPVIFACNGGPIVAATPLHMGGLGPRRIAYPDDLAADVSGFPIVDNEYCLLDVADLVFFDPAGTGFSRVAEGVDPATYYGVDADARQMATWIEGWLRDHDRSASPVYLVGESYGSIRVAVVSELLTALAEPVHVEGVVLVSQATNIIETCWRPANILSYAVSLPTLTAIAWYHGKIDRAGRTLDDVITESSHFADTEYLSGLFQGDDLPAGERDRLAERLASLTGIPASRWAERNLRLSKHDFRAELLAAEGLVLYMYDGRYAGPPAVPEPAVEGSFSARVGGPVNPTGVSAIVDALEPAIATHLKDFLETGRPGDYRGMEPPADAEGRAPADVWRWGATSPFGDWPYMDSIARAMTRAPAMRLLICTGLFDLTTTIGAARHAVRQSAWPRERVRTAAYAGGHMMYSVEASLRELSGDLRDFVKSAPVT
ncbi:S10 family peptidase [Nonomuraea sp. NPDC051941]|uniref:S10 family peptidase n=1 Tax=Nonomuraea sp. NPDC051941 TaxID=3364373 RepID=UPI0037CBCE08